MGKRYPIFNKEKFELPKEKFSKDICSLNGTYCLSDCKYKETKICKRIEINNKEKS